MIIDWRIPDDSITINQGNIDSSPHIVLHAAH